MKKNYNPTGAIAVIGLAGRWPGARDPGEFWRNLVAGVESISRLRDHELEAGDAALWAHPDFVKARAVLADADLFDAEFWGMYPKEAEITDPQHRVFMECAWEALEDAGYDSQSYAGSIGVYAGCSMNTYFVRNLCSDREFVDEFTRTYQVGSYPALVGNHIDFLATRIAYKLNLRGPAITVQSGCSTSLVAIVQACQSLLAYQADMMLAGGVSISFPQKRGYLYQPDGMVSPDGHCRTFDEKAQGTVFGSGSAVVLLKRLEDALADGDHIYAVARGFALNNDGSAKVGFAAPGVEGQSEVIAMAQAMAGVSPASIQYLEAHGTATPLGDPIEIAAATRAFRAGTQAKQFCAIGTAKTNVGHLDVAAGATGFIKTVLSLEHEQLPPTLHFERPNPKLDLENSPFYINAKLADWKRSHDPRRAGVSAFGVGGTNAHVVLEEAPLAEPSAVTRAGQLLVLSARTTAALDVAGKKLAEFLRHHSATNLADVAHTLQSGRKAFEYRTFVVAANASEAIAKLEAGAGKRVSAKKPPVVFMFPGQGAQYPGMGRGLYEAEPEYRRWVDACCEILQPLLPQDLREVLYSANPQKDDEKAMTKLKSTVFAQPAIFVTEFALAKLWMSWGITPAAMIGHSIGEFVAACLGGVFSLEDALRLVATRGRLMQDLPAGTMLAVRLPEAELRPLLPPNVSIAAVNSPALCVASGEVADIQILEKTLEARGIVARPLHTSHAFHSAMMDPVIAPFAKVVEQVELNPSTIPCVSCVSGDWVTTEQTTAPRYWATHLREPVRFADGVAALARLENPVLLEVGPGNTLSTLASQHPAKASGQIVVSSLPDASRKTGDVEAVLNALGTLWAAGVQPDWPAFHKDERLHRVSLPTYRFERKRYWIEPNQNEAKAASASDVSVATQPAVNVEPKSEDVPMSAYGISTVSIPRTARLESELAQLFQDLSGIDASTLDAAANFTELGFDSLFLTQAAQQLHSKFGVKVTFRQLLDQQSSLRSLAAFLDTKLPPDTAPRTSASQPAIPIAHPAQAATSGIQPSIPANASHIESLMKEQLHALTDLISKQLAVLGTNAAAQPIPPSGPTFSRPAAATADKAEPKAFGPYKPLSKGTTGGLTEAQQRHIDALIARYTRKTAQSKALTQRYRKVMADPRVVAGFRAQWKEIVYPLVTTRSEGSKLYDVDGNEYIDILNGYGPTVFGHKPKFVTDAVSEQLEKGFEIGPMSPLAGKVAELVSELTGMERVAFTNTGSEAVLCAMRVARTATGRNKVVMFTGDYHGMFDEVLIRGIKRPNGEPHSLPIAPGIPPQAAENIVVLDYGTAESLEYIRAHAAEFAAVMVEPVQSRHPNLQPREFLHKLRKITAEAGTVLIFDEVVTGFRTHPGGAQAIFGIRADLATYGKVIGGGLPIGLLAGKSQFMDVLDGGAWQFGDDSFPEVGVTFFAGTFVRHPLALAATYSVLQHLKEQGPQLQEQLNARTAALVSRLNSFLKQHQVPLAVENFASVFYFSFPSDLRFGTLFYYHMREQGIHIQEGFPCFLTTAHTDADIDRIVAAFEHSFSALIADGMLPGVLDGVANTADEIVVNVSQIQEAPLTEAQMEVWLAAQLSDDASCAYNESLTLHLRGSLNEPALRASIQELVDRHDALRTTFTPTGDRQRFAAQQLVEMPLLDLSGLAPAERDVRLAALKAAEAKTPFDLINGPVVRLQLVRLAPDYHAILFTAHHIVCDGWSTNVLLDELSQLYSAKCQGTNPDLPQPMSFAAYATSQKHAPQAEDLEAEKYWLAQFADTPEGLNLPTDRPRPAVRSYAGATCRHSISADVSKSIKQAGAKRGSTLFVTLLAGFQALLSRFSGQHDIVVGIPAASQSLLEGQTLVGHGVNFLPIRARVNDGMKFSDFLARQKQNLLDAYEHQNYTYGTLVRTLGLRRDTHRLPLLEAQFNLERVGTGAKFVGLQTEVDPNAKAFVNFDLFLNIVESDTGLVLDCDYNTSLYDEATIARWLGHYETMLRGFVADPTQRVDSLPLLSDQEQQQILVDWNATDASYPADRGIHELFAAQVERNPHAVAVVFEDQQLTYAQLNQRANQLANSLLKSGATGKVVGIYMDRSAEMMVALLGVLKSGAAYLPLDPEYPQERIDFILGEAQVPVLLTQSNLAPRLPRSSARTICLDTDWPLMARESQTNPPSASDSDSLAYVIYTSGSTGKPKGVEVTHRSVVNLLTSMACVPGMSANDTLLAVTTLSFDIAALELFLPLIVGGKLVIARREVAADPVRLMARLASCGTTFMQATPVTWRMLLEAGWDGRPLRKILCGGEALPQELADRLTKLPAELWNMYGPTETTIWSATSQVRTGERVTIGPPIANTQFYILDRNRQPTPIGVPGELYIAGDGVARGYHRRPELTTERFVANPFRPGSRMYRTGDSARYLPNGTIEFLGRLDFQVKLRGYRIELEEIESVLAQHPAVREAVAIVREDAPGDQRLVAYLVARDGSAPSPADLRQFAGGKLPDYMVPSAFVTLPSLPLTANGKIDRRALPKADLSQSLPQREIVPARTTSEQEMARIWMEVLKLDRVSVHDNLLELGADSIHIFQITARANDAGMSITAKQLLQSRTIAAVCEAIESSRTRPAPPARIQRVAREAYQVKS